MRLHLSFIRPVAVEVNPILSNPHTCLLLNLLEQIFGQFYVDIDNLVRIQAVDVAMSVTDVAIQASIRALNTLDNALTR